MSCSINMDFCSTNPPNRSLPPPPPMLSPAGPAVGNMGCRSHVGWPSSSPGDQLSWIQAVDCIWDGPPAALGIQLLRIWAVGCIRARPSSSPWGPAVGEKLSFACGADGRMDAEVGIGMLVGHRDGCLGR